MTNRPNSPGQLVLRNFLLFITFILPMAGMTQGTLVVNQDERVGLLVEKHIELNKTINGIPGYRIQVFFASGSDSRDRAHATKAELLKKTSEHDVYVLFEAPYYKVRVGDFRTHLDAERALLEIRTVFPGAFIVEDRIQLPVL